MRDLADIKKDRNYRKKKTDKKYEAFYKIILIISVFFFTGLGLVIQNINFTGQENVLRELIMQKRNLEIEITPYIIEENNIVQLSSVEDYAKKILKMDFPAEKNVKKILVGPEQ